MGKPDFGAMSFPPLAVGAGGFNTGGGIADDGTRVSRADTHNGYVRSPGDLKWSMLIRPGDNIAASLIDVTYFDPSPWGQTGAYEVAICATNSSVIYVVAMGYVYKTTDKAVTLTRTALAQQANLLPNESGRQTGPCMAVDPINANVVWLMTKAGARLTIDGGASWSNISTATLPAPNNGGRAFIAFDRNSAQSGGRTQGLYAFVNGVGLYRSTDAGTAWSLVASSPTGAGHLAVNALNGHVYLAGEASGEADTQVRRYVHGAGWTAPAGVLGKCVAPSLHNAAHVLAFNSGSYMRVSTDGGDTFDDFLIHTRAAPNIPWHAATNETHMTNGVTYSDPTTPNRWYCHEGIGAWYADFDPATGTAIEWVEDSVGIEGLVTTHLLVTPNGRLIGGFHDRPFFAYDRDRIDRYPDRHGPDMLPAIAHGQMTDYAPEDPEFIVGVNMRAIGPYQSSGCFSEDGGRTWQFFPVDLATVQGGKVGGNIVAVSKTNYVWLPSYQGHPMFTKDAGATWSNCNINGNIDRGWHRVYFDSRMVLAHDKETGNVLLYNVGSDPAEDWNETQDAAQRGIYRSQDGGETWTKIRAALIVSRGADYYNGKLLFVPGKADHVFWCGGDNSPALHRSTDGGVTWTAVPGSAETFCYGFGKAARGADYPAIAAIGYRGAEFGLWWSLDNCATWEKLAEYPGGRFDGPMYLAGDMGRFGRFYIGYTGSGVVVADFAAQVLLT